MKALRLKPQGSWEVINIDNTLEALQQEVDGYIECITVAGDLCIIVDEEGIIKQKEANKLWGRRYYGTILLVGVNGDDFCDIPDATIELLGGI